MVKNERGSLVLAMVIGIGLIAGAFALFNYLGSSRIALSYAADRSRIDPAQNYIMARLKSCTMLVDLASCPKSAEFRTLMTLPGTMLDATTVAPVAPITLTKADMEGTAGFLSSRLPDIDDALSDFTARVDRQNSVEDPIYGSTRVTITLTTKPNSHSFGLKPREVSKSFRVTIQSPLTYGLLLRYPTQPGVNLVPAGADNSSLTVIGGTLFFTPFNLALKPQLIVDPGMVSYVRFDRTSTTANAIAIDDSNDRSSYRAFASGIRVHAFDGIANPFISMGFWEQKLDYAYVYKAGGYPLPGDVTNAAHSSNCDRQVDYDKPTGTAQARSSVTSFPSALVMGAGVSLNETCARPDNFAEGSIKALVLLRASANLSFDYGAEGGAQYACGMVAGNKVTFNVPAGQSVAWYGHVSANQIIVTGGGHLTILNPFSAANRTGDLPTPPNLAIDELKELFLGLGSSTAHNYFVPFSRNPGTLPVDSNLNVMSSNFEGDPPPKCMFWKLAVDPPDLSTYLKGATWDQDLFFNAEEGL